MNLLQHTHPAGIEVNTFRIRRDHVGLDQDGAADPMNPNLFRTFRRFRHDTARGADPADPTDARKR